MPLDLSDQTETRPPARRTALPEMTPQQLRQAAQRLLTGGLSSRTWQVLDRLTIGGALGAWQLCQPPLSARTLRTYASQQLITRLPFQGSHLEATFAEYGLPYTSPTGLFVLGPIGLEIAKQRHEYPALTGYLAYPLKRVMHDVLANEVGLRLAAFAQAAGWQTFWLSKYEATLRRNDRAFLEPDGMLRLRKRGAERLFCIEYHNEDHQTRAWRKVNAYESAFSRTDIWQEQWDTDDFPTLLAVMTRQIAGQGYIYTTQRRDTQVTYLGKVLKGVLQDNLGTWVNFKTEKRVPLLP